jgi:hypothetical protein
MIGHYGQMTHRELLKLMGSIGVGISVEGAFF